MVRGANILTGILQKMRSGDVVVLSCPPLYDRIQLVVVLVTAKKVCEPLVVG